VQTFIRLLNAQFHAGSLKQALVGFDQAMWPDEVASWALPSREAADRHFVAADLQIHPGWVEHGTLEKLIGNACGQGMLQGSWIVSSCYPGKAFAACDPGVTSTAAVLERHGVWLVWYVSVGYQGP